MSAFAHPQKSTIVRAAKRSAAKTQLRALRAGFELLGTHAPRLATQLAERVFRTPPSPSPRRSDEDVFYFADPFVVEHAGAKIQAWSFGEGPTVVLVHGWGGRGAQLRGFIEPLVRRGFRVVTFDAPGHGASGPGLSSLPEVAAATRAVLNEVRGAHAVIAHSMGGPAVVLAMQGGANVKRLALVAPPTDIEGVTHRFARFLHVPEPVRVGLEHALERRFTRSMRDLDVVPFAKRASAPLLVVHDRGDRDVPFGDGARLARVWPNARLVATEGLGHTRILRDPGVIEEIVDFVADDALQGGANVAGAA